MPPDDEHTEHPADEPERHADEPAADEPHQDTPADEPAAEAVEEAADEAAETIEEAADDVHECLTRVEAKVDELAAAAGELRTWAREVIVEQDAPPADEPNEAPHEPAGDTSPRRDAGRRRLGRRHRELIGRRR